MRFDRDSERWQRAASQTPAPANIEEVFGCIVEGLALVNIEEGFGCTVEGLVPEGCESVCT